MADEKDEALVPDENDSVPESPHDSPDGSAVLSSPQDDSVEDQAAEAEGEEAGNAEVEKAEDEAEAKGKRGKKPKGPLDLSKIAAVAEPERLDEINIKSTVEAVLFAADEPVTPAQIAKAIGGVKPATVRKTVLALRQEHQERSAGFEIVEEAGGWTILTREDFAPYVRRLRKAAEGRKLSAAALETLAVVAYKQPVQRTDVEDIRGVGSGPMLRTLMEKGLVRIAGRAEALGRPLLYATTKLFLSAFGLGSLKDLPKMGEVVTGPPPEGGEESVGTGSGDGAEDSAGESSAGDAGGGTEEGPEDGA